MLATLRVSLIFQTQFTRFSL